MSERPTETEAGQAQPAPDPGTPGREAEEVPGTPGREAKAVPGTPGREAEALPGSGSAAGDAVSDELEELVADMRRERDEYLDLARRAKADFDNYRKRTAREAADAERRGKASLARELVPSVDSLERALAAAEQGSEVARGLELVHGELQSTLARAGVEAYDPLGERFDPAVSEAISTRPGEPGVDPGTVVETLERGYRFDGTVLRPARVIVSD